MLFVPGVWRWVLFAGAVLLPYVAVVFANQANTKGRAADRIETGEPEDRLQLTVGNDLIVPGEQDIEDEDHDRHESASAARAAQGPSPTLRRTLRAAPDRRPTDGRWRERGSRGSRPATDRARRTDLLGQRLSRGGQPWICAGTIPKIHTASRRKHWLACREHQESLSAFLSARGFLCEVVPLG